jgi:hypothetical protein
MCESRDAPLFLALRILDDAHIRTFTRPDAARAAKRLQFGLDDRKIRVRFPV